MCYHCYGVWDTSNNPLHCADLRLPQCGGCQAYQRGRLEPHYQVPAIMTDINIWNNHGGFSFTMTEYRTGIDNGVPWHHNRVIISL